MQKNKSKINRNRRHARLRSRLSGTKERPRLSVFRSSKSLYVQLIDDEAGKTILAARSQEIIKKKETPIAIAKLLGQEVAKRAQAAKIKEVVFDRGGFAYAGRVRALAEGAREKGLVF